MNNHFERAGIQNALQLILNEGSLKEQADPCAPSHPPAEYIRSTQIVRTFKKTLEDHYRDLVNGSGEKIFRVQDYATVQNLHPNYLSRVIKLNTGKPISAWIIDKTIAQAKSLLAGSSASVKEIAYQLGFSESAHFSNYFKKYTNHSPISYRRRTSQPDL